MSNVLRLSVRWDCVGDELSPHRNVVLRFYDDQMETTRAFSLKELGELSRARPSLSQFILRSSWQVLVDARMVSGDEDAGEVLRLIERALAFAMADTGAPNHTRRTMLQVLRSPDVVVKTEQTDWQPTKMLWRSDL